jgi:hypothetical protein
VTAKPKARTVPVIMSRDDIVRWFETLPEGVPPTGGHQHIHHAWTQIALRMSDMLGPDAPLDLIHQAMEKCDEQGLRIWGGVPQ